MKMFFTPSVISLALRFKTLHDALLEALKVLRGLQPFLAGLAHHLRQRHGADVGNVHGHAGDDELPAGGHGVVARVLKVVAQLDKAGNDHVVVGVLREAQPLLGELGAVFVHFQRRIPVDAQVDLRVDAAHLQAGGEAEGGEVVAGVLAVLVAAAQHQALAVVALLHAGVEVAVAVEGEEELLEQFQRLVVAHAPVQIGLQIGPHVLVKAPHGVVVDVRGPQRQMQHAQHAQGIEEILRAVAHGVLQPFAVRQRLRVAVGKGDHRVDGLDGGLEEVPVAAPLGKRLFRPRAAGQQTLAQNALVIGGNVAHAALLVDEMPGEDAFLLALGVDVGELGNGADAGDALIRAHIDALVFQKQPEPAARRACSGACPRAVSARGCLRQRLFVQRGAQRLVLALDDPVQQCFDSLRHNATALMPYFSKMERSMFGSRSVSKLGLYSSPSRPYLAPAERL